MSGIAPQKKEQPGKINKLALVLSILFFLALIGSVAVNVYTANKTNLFSKVEFGAELQNSQIYVDEELGITFLGTYQNKVLAFDKDENKIWEQEIAGASSVMAYDTESHWLMVGSQDRNVYVYEAETGNLVNKLACSGKVYDMDYDQATGRLVLSACVKATKNYMQIFDVHTGEELLNVKLKNETSGLKFSADKQYIFTGDTRARITKYDLNGEQVAQAKGRNSIQGLAVSQTTGDVYTIDENGNLYKFDSELNEVFNTTLVGEGRNVSCSTDGCWVGVGTREGDTYILDADGTTHFSNTQDQRVTQVYFGTESCYIVTISRNLYEFSVDRLDNITTYTQMHQLSKWGIAVFAVGLIVCTIIAIPASRKTAKRVLWIINRNRVAYLMLAPSIVLILIFNYYNVFQAFYYAFTDWSLSTRTMREVNFIGFDNFVKMFNEGYFLLGVKNLLILMVTGFAKLLTVPVFLAELVFAMRTLTGKSSRRRYWFRLLLVVPMVVPGVVSTLMWKNIFDPNIGALNSFLDLIGKSEWKHSWLGDPSTALWSVVAMGFPWVNSFAFLVFYGGLINIPEDLFEAAKVDGSNPVWNFFHIHLPLISPQIKMLLITTFIGSVQDYGGVYLLTQGGPGTATYVPGLELYYAATKFGQYGYACAMGLVMFIVILIGSMLNLRIKTQELN